VADGIFNVGLGRWAELVNRVDANEPTNSALIIVALKSAGLVTDAELKDLATLAVILEGASDEATNSGYSRKVFTDTDLVAASPDNVNDRQTATMPNPEWKAVAEAGGKWGKLLVCYDADTTSGTDANIIPLVHLDYLETPSGSDLKAEVNALGFAKAS
jgi:hypothetical protein